MLISSKGRYALRVMLDLAQQDDTAYIILTDVARRQEISEKYLEGILAALSRAGLVLSLRGRGGGYRLAKKPEAYTVGEILRAAEGRLAPVSCLGTPEQSCARAESCLTLPLWTELERLTDDYLNRVTLAQLLEGTLRPGAAPRDGETPKEETT